MIWYISSACCYSHVAGCCCTPAMLSLLPPCCFCCLLVALSWLLAAAGCSPRCCCCCCGSFHGRHSLQVSCRSRACCWVATERGTLRQQRGRLADWLHLAGAADTSLRPASSIGGEGSLPLTLHAPPPLTPTRLCSNEQVPIPVDSLK